MKKIGKTLRSRPHIGMMIIYSIGLLGAIVIGGLIAIIYVGIFIISETIRVIRYLSWVGKGIWDSYTFK